MALYDYQKRLKTALYAGESVILQAPTGAGKTRGALAPFIENFFDDTLPLFPRKCIYSVPMRVLANQFVDEYEQLSSRYAMRHDRKISVGIQTGERPEDREFQSDLIFATIDQTLSSWLLNPYALSGRRGNMNAGALVGSYLIFDEFHLFDSETTLPTTLQMLKQLKGVSQFLLMTATFSKGMLDSLANQLDATAFLIEPNELEQIPAQKKDRRYFCVDTPLATKSETGANLISKTAVQAILTQHKTRTLVVCNQVERAQTLWQALVDAAPEGTEVRLLHSRFTKPDRAEIETFVRTEFNKDKTKHTQDSVILVGTQVVEVGLDMTCETLHTELAPANAVLQRAGRCARYENEAGQVYVYKTENNAPYISQRQNVEIDETWGWLVTNQNRHLAFADEQVLINAAHQRSDNEIVIGLGAGEIQLEEDIQRLWRGDDGRAEAKRLIRDIRSVAVTLHADPDVLLQAPFQAELFSLHPGTLYKHLDNWLKAGDLAGVEWIAKRLWEDETADAQGYRQKSAYDWKEIQSAQELWGALMIVINPELVGYNAQVGFTLFPSTQYNAQLLGKNTGKRNFFSGYKQETYYQHIALVHAAFTDQWPNWARNAQRLETQAGWEAGTLKLAAEVAVWLHDVGKLSTGWQDWAHAYQAEIGEQVDDNIPLAHTDFDSKNESQRQAERLVSGKQPRPWHALESALATLKIIRRILPAEALQRAVFTAIARHHSPSSKSYKTYSLKSYSVQELKETATRLSALEGYAVGITEADLVTNLLATRFPETTLVSRFMVRPKNFVEMSTYFLLVRALRHADGEGTARGSQ